MKELQIAQKITNRTEETVLDQYLHDIAKIPLIPVEKEIELSQRIQAGDSEALHKLVNANLRFVVSVAKTYEGLGLPLMDLISEGNIGLIEAARRFDATRGFKFISYAVTWIRQSIFSALNKQIRTIRVPVNKSEQYVKIMKVARKLETELHRTPSSSEIAEAMCLPEETVLTTIQSSKSIVSLDAPVGDESDCTLMDLHLDDSFVSPEQELQKQYSQKFLLDCLNTLPSNEAQVVKLFFGIGTDYPLSCGEIGLRLGCSDRNVRTIKDKALRHLRKSSNLQMFQSCI